MSEDPLTLEKLHICDRLQNLEKEVLRLSEIINYRNTHCYESMAQVSKFIEKMDEELNGSRDEPGLKVKLDRIQQIVETRTKHVFIIYVTLIGLVVGWVFKWISTLAK